MRARIFRLLGTAALAGLAAVGPTTAGAPARPPPASSDRLFVHVVPIEGVIDLGLAPFVERILGEAAAAGAAAAILEVNTFGGRVDAAVLIRDALLRARADHRLRHLRRRRREPEAAAPAC